MSTLNKKGLKFNKHRPKDPLDPGFSISGLRLKWMSPQKTEDRAGGIWEILRPDTLPIEVLTEMKKNNLFASGDTIRNKELVLGFCTEEVHQEMRKEKQQLADDQLRRIKALPHNATGMKIEEATVTHGRTAEDAFRD